MWRGLREIRSDVSLPGKRRSAGEAQAQQGEGLACQADPFDPFDGRPFASEVRLLATSPRLRKGFALVAWGDGLPLGGGDPGNRDVGPGPALRERRPYGTANVLPLSLAGDVALGFGKQFAGLWHAVESFLHQRIVFNVDPAGYCFAENGANQLEADTRPDEIRIVFQALIGYRDFLLGKKLPEFLKNSVRYLKVARNGLVNSKVMQAELGESAMLQERFLSGSELGVFVLDIRRDATTAINLTTAVGEAHIRVRRGGILRMIVIIVKRNVVIVALNQPAARGVVAGGGQRQARVLAEREDSLNKALAEAGLAHHQGAIVIL